MKKIKHKESKIKEFFIGAGITKLIPIGIISVYLLIRYGFTLPYKLLETGINPLLAFTISTLVANLVYMPVSWMIADKNKADKEEKWATLFTGEAIIMIIIGANHLFWWASHGGY